MLDPANTGGGNPSATKVEAPAQTGYQPPEGKILLDANEHAVLKQNNERVRGMQGYYEAGSKYGLKKPEDFESIGKWRSFLKDRGMTEQQIMAAYAAPEQEESGGGAAFDTSKFLTQEQLESKLSERDAFHSAMSQHTKAMEAEPTIVSKLLAEALPETADPRDKRLLAAEVKAMMAERGVYPADHKLSRHEYAPWNEAGIKGLVEKAKKELALSDGAEMAAIGKKAAAAKPVGTPAGNRASQGKPHDEQPASANERMDSAAERWAKKSGLV